MTTAIELAEDLADRSLLADLRNPNQQLFNLEIAIGKISTDDLLRNSPQALSTLISTVTGGSRP
jgi:hypothetical protein